MKNPVIKVILALGLATASISYADWHALVIGIDDYQHINNLGGAVNDANDIVDALSNRTEGIYPTVLLDRQADYDTVKQWWENVANTAKPGDIVFFSMAGHGSIEPEHYPNTDNKSGDKRNAYDEVFILSGYHPKGEASRQRIVDNELFGWYKKVTDKGAQVIVVADFCYGGGMTRSTSIGRDMGDKIAKVRNARGSALSPEDKSKRGSLTDAQLTVSSPEFQKRLFIARPFSDENRKVEEKILNNQARGILSYLTARGLRGEADSNGDGKTTAGEFSNYLYEQSRSLSNMTQDSALEPGGRVFMKKDLFKNAQLQPPTNPPIRQRQSVYLSGKNTTNITLDSNSPFYQSVDSVEKARYRWNTDNNTIIESGIGEVAYNIQNVTDLRSFLQNQRLVDGLKASRLPRFGGAIVLDSEKQLDKPKTNVFAEGESVAIYTQALADFPYLILINVPSKANVQFINSMTISNLQSLPSQAQSQHVNRLIGVTQVTPPFGADHLLMLAVNTNALTQNPLLRKMVDSNSLSVTANTHEQLLQIVQSLGKEDARLAVVPFSTTAKP